ncbi:MAG TPA: methyltransferase domain-containing protein, partial [Candidatus Baltobacteraceae bacterium]|nr:methyltransferase domain-containing protein [Candidatus Baltobacteraceae bacterium]
MQAKGYKGMGMEGRVAKWYAKTTRSAMDDFKTLAKRMSASLAEGSSVLEVAPGPGYFAIELAKLGNYKITGLDISKTFVDIAGENARAEGVEINFRHGNASSMPFEDNCFDLIVCRAAFKNFSDPVGALKEMRRVLRPGGKALIIDLRKDTPKEEIYAHVDKMKIGPLDTAFTKLAFRTFLLKRAYTRADFTKFIAESGFQQSDIREE